MYPQYTEPDNVPLSIVRLAIKRSYLHCFTVVFFVPGCSIWSNSPGKPAVFANRVVGQLLGNDVKSPYKGIGERRDAAGGEGGVKM